MIRTRSSNSGAIRWTPLQAVYERWLRPYESFWATSLTRLAAQIEQDFPPAGGERD